MEAAAETGEPAMQVINNRGFSFSGKGGEYFSIWIVIVSVSTTEGGGQHFCVGIRQPTFIKFKENAKLNLISKKLHNIFNTLYWKTCRLLGSQKMKLVA